MNLKTITFDADKWQLMPKVATDEMNAAAAYTETFAEAYTALLAAAPQPETVSPWMPIDDFLSSETFGVVWVKTKDDIRLCNHRVLGMFVGVLTGALFTKREVTHVILLERPQAPTGAAAPEVE